MTWKREPVRHSLASRGIKTKIDDVEEYDVEKIREILEPLTMSDNPYIEFTDKHNNPVDNAVLKKYEYVDGDEAHEHLFHTTSVDWIENISIEGLRTDANKKWEDSFDAIYFSEFPAYSIMWEIRHLTFDSKDCIYERNGDCSFALLRVPEEKIDYKWDEQGTQSNYGTSFYTKKNTPPELIEIKTRAGWMNLKDYVELREEYL